MIQAVGQYDSCQPFFRPAAWVIDRDLKMQGQIYSDFFFRQIQIWGESALELL